VVLEKMEEKFTQPRELVRGVVERIVYVHEDSHYSVLRIGVEHSEIPVTAIGQFLDIQIGEELQLHGYWAQHPKYGRQFRTTSYVRNQPSTLRGIRRYLDSMVDGIGPKLAERLVKYFGLDTLRIIDEEPHRLTEVKGIAKSRVSQIQEAWNRHRVMQEVMVFLRGYDITQNQALRIVREYGQNSIQIVRDNPYRLATDIHGIGFRTADEIARSLGIPADSIERARAAVMFQLERAAEQGHLFLPQDVLISELTSELDLMETRLKEAIEILDRETEIVLDHLEDQTPILYRRVLAACERGSARLVRELLEYRQLPLSFDVSSRLQQFERETDIQLAPPQREAIAMGLTARLSIITGGPGTGKTTIVDAICKLAKEQDQSILLAAPTGRAAKRMEEASGIPAKTLHRLLEFAPQSGQYQRNRERPLKADLVIVDEASMIDIYLFYALVRALPDHARLLLVGDADQLPSVGPGQILRDLIASERIPVTRLTDIFRQRHGGLIVENAHRINQGQIPVLPTPSDRELLDFYFIPCDQPARAANIIVELVTSRIPQRFDFDPLTDIQVISPMHRGDVGVQQLNAMLQQKLQAHQPAISLGEVCFHLGDRVLHTRNDYDKEVFNGDIGWIEEINPANQSLQVRFDERLVRYERHELDDLTLAYAISVHKSQGSEYPAVVIPIMTQHFVMLQRNLLYTAITRGKRLVILVGTKQALKIAVQNQQERQRFSKLISRIQNI
jgi:exodeoxyribonuclease V alpha subunit